VIREQYSDGTVLQFTYNAGDRITATEGLSLGYDALGRVVSTAGADGVEFGAAYDAGGRLQAVTYAGGLFTVRYGYDARNLLTSVSDDLTGARVTFAYDDDGRLVRIGRSNGLGTAFTLDAAGRATTIEDGSAEGSVARQRYAYDARSQITRADLALPGEPLAGLQSRGDQFAVDAACQLTASGYAYDARGRLTAAPWGSLAWDGAGRLTGIGAVRLQYNGLHDLVCRQEGDTGTRYYYNYALAAPVVVSERDAASGELLRSYVWTPSGRLLYGIDHRAGNRPFFYHFDALGSTLFLSDAAGAVTDTYGYTPYGMVIGHTGSATQPFTYLGEHGVRQEGSQGLYHTQARYYDAVAGRFLSRDPVWLAASLPEELNPYLYAAGNPAKFVDPEGTGTREAIVKGGQVLKKLAKKGGERAGDVTGSMDKTKGRHGTDPAMEVSRFAFHMLPGSNEVEQYIRNQVTDGQGSLEDIAAGVFRDIAGMPTTVMRVGLDTGMSLMVNDYARQAARLMAAHLKGDLSGEQLMAKYAHLFGEEYAAELLASYGLGAIAARGGLMLYAGAELIMEGTQHMEAGAFEAYRAATQGFSTAGGWWAYGNYLLSSRYDRTDAYGAKVALCKSEREMRKSKNPFVRAGLALGNFIGGLIY